MVGFSIGDGWKGVFGKVGKEMQMHASYLSRWAKTQKGTVIWENNGDGCLELVGLLNCAQVHCLQ